MNSRERILATLEHKAPDRVPLDLAGSHVTGIHKIAYENLCAKLDMNADASFADDIQQVVIPSEEVLNKLEVDTRGLYPLCSHNWNVKGKDVGEMLEHLDEWGLTQHLPKNDGFWWSMVGSPMDAPMIETSQIDDFTWPNPCLPERIAGLREQAIKHREAGKIVMMKGLCAGVFEMGQRIRGMENFLCDLLADPDVACKLMDKILELKIQFWDMALTELGDVVDIVVESDDYGTQASQLVSPDTFRELIKPRVAELISSIKDKFTETKKDGEKGYFFFHSCGNVRSILPDFIEIGVDILNPVHISATGMNPVELKRDFGKDVTFWGGGIETQNILPNGTPEEIKEDVKRNLDALMPGGGYVFNTVHNIQAEIPPENVMAMYEALREFGKY